MSYKRTNWTNTTPINTTNLNNIEEGIVNNENIELIGVGEELPTLANEEDKYYLSTDNNIYIFINNEWIEDSTPKTNIFYIVPGEQKNYYYNGSTLISVGGDVKEEIAIQDEEPTLDYKLWINNSDTSLNYNNEGEWEEISTKFPGVPTGSIMTYISSSAPEGWLICDGAQISRTTYSELFNIIGTTYGTGDGSTTFNLPNLKGRTIVGLDTSQTEFNSINKKGGEKTHKLTLSEIPSHKHDDNIATAANGWRTWISGFRVGDNIDGYAWGSETYKGGDQAHNNLQPYIVMTYIIKA